jgi:hypothetical protein
MNPGMVRRSWVDGFLATAGWGGSLLGMLSANIPRPFFGQGIARAQWLGTRALRTGAMTGPRMNFLDFSRISRRLAWLKALQM